MGSTGGLLLPEDSHPPKHRLTGQTPISPGGLRLPGGLPSLGRTLALTLHGSAQHSGICLGCSPAPVPTCPGVASLCVGLPTLEQTPAPRAGPIQEKAGSPCCAVRMSLQAASAPWYCTMSRRPHQGLTTCSLVSRMALLTLPPPIP